MNSNTGPEQPSAPRRRWPSRRPYRDRQNGLPWILPAMIVSVGVLYYSFVYTGYMSTLKWDGASPLQTFVEFDNYRKVFDDPIFWTSLRNTAVFYVGVFAAQVVLGMTFAALLHSRLWFRGVYKLIIFVPVVLSIATVAPVFRQIFLNDGYLNQALTAIGLDSLTQAWLGNPTAALSIIILVGIWQSTGVVFILYYAAMSHIDNQTLEAARLDGAGNFRVMVSIVWPAVRGTTIAIAILTAIGSLKTFEIPWLITYGGPVHATEFLGTMIYRTNVQFAQVGYSSAISIVLLILAIGTAIVIRFGTRNA